jgi:hypothetical protein
MAATRTAPGLRIAVLLLLLANVAFFAWVHYFSAMPGISTETHLLQQQLRPDAIRLLPAQQVGVPGARTACMEWGGFPPEGVARAEASLGQLLPGVAYTPRRVEEPATWWVFMPPQADRQRAQQKTAELKRLGIEEFFIVQDESKFRFAISLGVFRTQEAAKNKLEELRAQGVRTAQIGPREAMMQITYFQLRDLTDSAKVALGELRQSFAGTELRACGSSAPAPLASF